MIEPADRASSSLIVLKKANPDSNASSRTRRQRRHRAKRIGRSSSPFSISSQYTSPTRSGTLVMTRQPPGETSPVKPSTVACPKSLALAGLTLTADCTSWRSEDRILRMASGVCCSSSFSRSCAQSSKPELCSSCVPIQIPTGLYWFTSGVSVRAVPDRSGPQRPATHRPCSLSRSPHAASSRTSL